MEVPGDHTPEVGEASAQFPHHSGFIPTVHHTVLTTGILAGDEAVPIRLFHEFLEGGIVSIRDQVAR